MISIKARGKKNNVGLIESMTTGKMASAVLRAKILYQQIKRRLWLYETLKTASNFH